MSKILCMSATAAMLALAVCFGGNAARATDTVPAAAAKKLSNESLQTMLENMGHTMTAGKSGASVFYNVKMPHKDLDYTVTFELSTNQQYLWVTIALGSLPKDNVAPERLRRLLEMSSRIAPSQLLVYSSNGAIVMAQALPNRDVTPLQLRTCYEGLLSQCEATRDVWQVKDWSAPITNTTAAK